MGIVSLPSMDDIQQQKDPRQQMEMLINTLGILMKELGEINGYLGGANIRANSITAVKLDVDQLSAITANLGTITAGIIRGIEIYGSTIATAEGTYPRAEMSSTENLFKAATSVNQYVSVLPFFAGPNAPIVQLVNGAIAGAAAEMYLNSTNGRLTFSSGLSIVVSSGTGSFIIDTNNVFVGSQQGITGTFYASATPGGSPTVPITFTNGIRTG